MATISQLKKRVDKLYAKVTVAANTRDERIAKQVARLKRKYKLPAPKTTKKPQTRSHSDCSAEVAAYNAQLTVAAQAAINAQDAAVLALYEEAFAAYLFQVAYECVNS